jgi:hypothetical protein
MSLEIPKTKSPARLWLKRLGLAGFLFFFVKGLAWIGVFVAVTYFGCNYFR